MYPDLAPNFRNGSGVLILLDPCVRSVGCVCIHLNTFGDDSECPWTMRCLFSNNDFCGIPSAISPTWLSCKITGPCILAQNWWAYI